MTDTHTLINRDLVRRVTVYDRVTVSPGLGSDCEIEITRHTAEIIPFKRRQAQPNK